MCFYVNCGVLFISYSKDVNSDFLIITDAKAKETTKTVVINHTPSPAVESLTLVKLALLECASHRHLRIIATSLFLHVPVKALCRHLNLLKPSPV